MRRESCVELKSGQTTTPDEIRRFCRNKVAYFKIPQPIRFVDSCPMTANGKVQKYFIRRQEIRDRDPENVAGIATA